MLHRSHIPAAHWPVATLIKNCSHVLPNAGAHFVALIISSTNACVIFADCTFSPSL